MKNVKRNTKTANGIMTVSNKVILVVQCILLLVIPIHSGLIQLAWSLPVETGSWGGLSYAKDEDETYQDYRLAIYHSHGIEMETMSDSLPHDVREVYVAQVEDNGTNEYWATIYYSGEIQEYDLVGDLSGKLKMYNGWWLTPNNYLYNINAYGNIEKLMQEFSATGETFTISWPSEPHKIPFYQRPLLGTAIKLKVWYKQDCPTWLKWWAVDGVLLIEIFIAVALSLYNIINYGIKKIRYREDSLEVNHE